MRTRMGLCRQRCVMSVWLALCLIFAGNRAASAQQAADLADKHTVLLRSGAFYRGTVVERVEDSRVVLQLRDGARVQIQRSEVLDETDEEDPPFRRSAIVIGPDGKQRSGEVLRYEPGVELLLSSAVIAPIRLSAAAKEQLLFVDTREALVLLKDGAIQRGVIVERSEGGPLTLQTPMHRAAARGCRPVAVGVYRAGRRVD